MALRWFTSADSPALCFPAYSVGLEMLYSY